MKQQMLNSNVTTQSGFTLIELLMIITVVAILASIAVPSYSRITIKNTEAKTESRMKQIQLELESWRANTLSFKGFAPKTVASDGTSVTYGYDDGSKKIYLPLGRNATNADYEIIIEDMTGASLSGAPNLNNVTTGSNWRMYATPLNSYVNRANSYYINSRGMRCKSRSSTFTIQSAEENNCTGSGVESW